MHDAVYKKPSTVRGTEVGLHSFNIHSEMGFNSRRFVGGFGTFARVSEI
jgi:hypothetical protein